MDTFSECFFKLINNDDKKCKQNSTVNYLDVKERVEKIKINLVKSLVSFFLIILVSRYSQRCSQIFYIIIEKTTFEGFEEICE